MFTTSFATGGFAPLLALFDGTGSLLFADSGIADNNCVLNGVDPATGDCYDSRLSWNSIGGAPYIIALTEYDNFALGPTIFCWIKLRKMYTSPRLPLPLAQNHRISLIFNANYQL